MDILNKLPGLLYKFRYPLLVLLLGVCLMMLPGKKANIQTEPPATTAAEEKFNMDDALQEILCQIQGAGKVRVMLSIAKGETYVYQTDSDTSGSENGISRIETVIVTDSQRGQSGLLQHVDPPTYLGAIIVCQGADSPTVKLAVTQAVSSITGLGADKISVLKMK